MSVGYVFVRAKRFAGASQVDPELCNREPTCEHPMVHPRMKLH